MQEPRERASVIRAEARLNGEVVHRSVRPGRAEDVHKIFEELEYYMDAEMMALESCEISVSLVHTS